MTSEVLLYINNNLDSKITLERLSEITGYSPFHLQRKLSADLGMSLGKYIQEQRLHTAAYFLALTKLPLDEIKYLVGFDDNSSFGRAFKKLYAVTPMQYRKSKRIQQEFPLRTFRYISTNGVLCKEQPQIARVFAYRGDYFSSSIYAIWKEVAAYIEAINKTPQDFEHYAILHECPHLTDNRESRYDAAIVPKGFKLPAAPYLQARILEGRYVRYNFCSKVQDYEAVSAEVNNVLVQQKNIEHRHGVSYFKFDSMPDPENPDNLFINWYLPVA
ncbi:AraC family transcriptional regulator [Chitinophaga polysaccharea]|uniref:AraC family transcriptional regulator n=1 Tax=Chitinophaga polysaccharea TaxID=1293035 RepID=A0A561PQP8_9BACT|nr:AraC family transcriptional regulator [Chitinophaga polysaccharea]TWF40391.1 AraC family transcriptional regulator [Chitinophaga polysaccharea]